MPSFIKPLETLSARKGSIATIFADFVRIAACSLAPRRIQFHTNKDLLCKLKRNEMVKISWLIGFDWDGEWAKTCTEDHPVPKSWGPGFDPITLKPVKITGTVTTANKPGSGKSVMAKAAEAITKKKAARKKPAAA